MTAEKANRIWDILVKDAGAHEHHRENFVHYLIEPVRHGHEYRFMGDFGFGGKLHYTPTRGAWVSCYPEDQTDERKARIDSINAELANV